MESQHHPEHDLRENDLEHFLGNFGQWWNKHGTSVLLTILIVLVVVFGYRFWTARAQSRHENLWNDLAATSSPDGYAEVAASTSDPAIRALAYLRSGDLYLSKAMPSSTATTAPAVDPVQALTSAQDMYKKVFEDARTPALYRLNARLGLASVAEARHDWAEARSQYQAIEKDAAEAYPLIRAQAQARGALLDRLAVPVTFAPEAPETQPAGATTQPATQPGQ